MSKEKLEIGEVVPNKTTIFYSFAGIADMMSYQKFTFYIFKIILTS